MPRGPKGERPLGRRGLFRLWVALTTVWIGSIAWLFRHELMLDCDAIKQADTHIDCLLSDATWVYGNRLAWLTFSPQATAIEWIAVPPICLFAIGCLGLWVRAGFARNNSN